MTRKTPQRVVADILQTPASLKKADLSERKQDKNIGAKIKDNKNNIDRKDPDENWRVFLLKKE